MIQTCLIYGQNGLDLDVTFNLKSFYEKLGFKVFFSTKLYDADLLVVTRAIDKPLDLSDYNYLLIHVYDYGGWDYDSFISSIDPNISYVFSTSESKMLRLVEKLNFPQGHVFKAFPPVDIFIWAKKIKAIKYDLVHIGNLKPQQKDDEIQGRFINILRQFKPHVWGLGWDLPMCYFHGKTGLFEVSKIYARSKFSLGLMYPFQRQVTFSGRFWHAPLNGCIVFSEPGIYTSNIPGIVETDYSINNVSKLMDFSLDRYKIQDDAKKFWFNQYLHTLAFVESTLSHLKNRRFSVRKVLNYFLLNSFCLIREFYQKMNPFRFYRY